MKAVFIREQGGLDTMIYGDWPEPTIGPREVLIRVGACAINRVDVYTREGSHGMRPPLPRVLGRDVAGEIVRVGEEVSDLKEGERVLALANAGGYAEYTKAERADVWPIPEGIGYDEAACFPTVATTAWHMLICTAKLRLGEDVLVMAAGSGVGSMALQLAKGSGARVFATAGADWKLEKARELGADFGINHAQGDFSGRVKELTDGQGVDLVFEHIGAAVWEQCFASLKYGGRLVTCGVTTGHLVQLHLGQLWTRELSLLGTRMHPREDMPQILRLVAQGKLRGIVGRAFALKDAPEAHGVMEASDFFGKIVLYP